MGLSLAVLWLRQVGLPRLAMHRVHRGGQVAVRARLRLDDRKEAAIVRRCGADLAVSTNRRTWLVRAADIAVARGRTSADEEDERWTLRLRTTAGSVGFLDVRGPWRGVVQSMAETASPDATSGGRTGPLSPLWAVTSAATSAVALTAWLSILLRATERTSPVLRITDEETSCWVEWSEGTSTLRGAPTCPDPLPAIGEPMPYLTTPWPVQGHAWDPDLPWVLAVLIGAALVVAAAVMLGTVIRARSRPAPERVSLVDAGLEQGHHTPTHPQSHAAGAASLVAALDQAEAELGWGDLPAGAPRRANWWADARTAIRSAPRWSLYLAIGGAVLALALSEDGASPFTVVGLVVTGFGVLWTLLRGVLLLVALRRPWHASTTTPWVHRAVQNASGEWWVLLLESGQPRWLVPLSARPPLHDTCRIRGELAHGAPVHVLIDGVLWLPTGGAVEVDEEIAAEALDDLHYQRTGDTPDLSLR